MPPQTIGPYQIIKELGRGNMGIVYLGYDADIGRPVAVKTIQTPDHDPEADALRQGLARDARAAGRLLHPNIVTIFQMGRDGDTLYVVMEYVAGTTVSGWSRAAPRAIHDIVALLSKVALALDYAHGLGIVHRDIKPTNILVAENGEPKVTDFGLAKLAGGSVSASSRLVGTPRYMSPEQIRGAHVDGRSDQFSLGIMAYELLTGRLPFPGDSLQTLMYQILMQDPAPAHEVNARLAPPVSRVLARALAKDAAARYPSCREFLNSLDAALRQPFASTASIPLPRPSPAAVPVRPRNPLRVAVVCGALAIAMGGPVVFLSLWKPGLGPDIDKTKKTTEQHSRVPTLERHETTPSQKSPGTASHNKRVELKTAHLGTTAPDPVLPPKRDFDVEATQALYTAVDSGRPMPVIEELIRRHASPDGEGMSEAPLRPAADKCRVDVAKFLLANGADAQARTHKDSDPPLSVAVRSGCTEIAALVLNAGEDPNRQTTATPPLIEAVKKKSAPLVRLLLDHKADPNFRPKFGETAMTAAAGACDTQILGMLLERGAKVDEPDSGWEGITPLMAAADRGCRPMVNILLGKGVRVNQADKRGRTAFYYAVKEQNAIPEDQFLPLLRELLNAGASPNVVPRGDHPGESPLMMATRGNKIEPLFRLLIERGADPKELDNEGQSALVYAASSYNLEAFRDLLARGAPVNARDKSGQTVLDHVKEIPEGVRERFLKVLNAAGAVE